MAINSPAAQPATLHGVSRRREFTAPVEALFRAHTDPFWFTQWIVPAGVQLRLQRWDPRSGGSWAYSIELGEESWGLFGAFHEVIAPLRLVQTVEAEHDSPGPVLEIMDFIALPEGGSALESLAYYPAAAAPEDSAEDDDTGWQRLAEFLATRRE